MKALMGLPPNLVILDFDGTLFDTHDAVVHCTRQTVKNMLLSEIPSSLAEKIQGLIVTVGSSILLHKIKSDTAIGMRSCRDVRPDR